MKSRRLFLIVFSVAVLVGCTRTRSTPGPAPTPSAVPATGAGPVAKAEFDAESGPHAAGKKAMVANRCFQCHAIDGARPAIAGGPMGGPGGPGKGPGGFGGPGGGMGRAPDLGKVGSDPTHTVEWISKYVKNPRSVNPDSRMTPFEGRISDGDLHALAEYLASLK